MANLFNFVIIKYVLLSIIIVLVVLQINYLILTKSFNKINNLYILVYTAILFLIIGWYIFYSLNKISSTDIVGLKMST